MKNNTELGIWFPTVRTNTGTDVFTENLVKGLHQQGIRAEITWLPLRAEYLPWTVSIPSPPEWATLVHVNTWLHTRFIPKNLPVIATLHHSIHDPKLRPYKGLLRVLYHQYWIAPNERRVMLKSKKVIAVSEYVADMAKQTLCNVNIEVIYNGIDTELFHPNSKKKKSNKPFRLLYVGSWMKRKGVDLIPTIMRELGDDFTLYYTGGKTAEKDKASMPPNMHDLGRLHQQQVIREMQNSDAFLFPSRSEGFGLVVIEAMACGLPCIVSNITVFNEIINNESGIIAPENNVIEIVNSIKKLQKDMVYRNTVSKNARLRIESHFTTEKMIQSYIKLYMKNHSSLNRI